MTTHQIIRIHPMAPPKPALGANCNGCGVCCAAEPCPVGVLISGRRQGACGALEWQEVAQRYVCGVVATPERHLGAGLGRVVSIFPTLLRRMISAGSGCDSDAQLID